MAMMHDRLKWTIKFLKEYQQLPCLWKKNDPDYRHGAKRENAEKHLMVASGLKNVQEVRSKIRSLRSTFAQEVLKIRKSVANGDETIYTPRLQWFPLASSFFGPSKGLVNADIGNESNSESFLIVLDENNKEDEMAEEEDPLICPMSPSSAASAPNSPEECIESPRQLRRQKRKNDDQFENAVHVLKQVKVQEPTNSDEFIHFGQHVATQLSCLPLKEAILLQEKIQNLITCSRLRCIRDPST